MAQGKSRGRFVWQELMTEDPDTASVFYSKLLGWHGHDVGGDTPYTEFHPSESDRSVAGMLKLPEGAKPSWLSYISVEDVDKAAVEIEGLGGKVVRPATDIPDIGRFAVVSDPQGAPFAIFKPEGPAAAESGSPKLGEFSWLELATTDSEAAFEFYAKVFGWQVLHRHDMGPAGSYLIFGSDGIQRGGIFKLGAERGATPNWLPYAAVADVDVSAREIPGFGGRVVAGPMDVPDGGRIVHLTDPGGVTFALHAQVKPKSQPVAKPAAATKSKPQPKSASATKPVAASSPPPAAAPAPKPAAAPKSAAAKPAAAVKPATLPKAAAEPTPAASPPAVKRTGRKTAKKAVKKAVKKAAKKVAKKAAKKAAKKVAKKAAKKAKKAGKTVGKASPVTSVKDKGKKKDKRKKDKHKKDKGKKKDKKEKARRKK